MPLYDIMILCYSVINKLEEKIIPGPKGATTKLNSISSKNEGLNVL